MVKYWMVREIIFYNTWVSNSLKHLRPSAYKTELDFFEIILNSPKKKPMHPNSINITTYTNNPEVICNGLMNSTYEMKQVIIICAMSITALIQNSETSNSNTFTPGFKI